MNHFYHVSEEIVNKYYENIEGLVQKLGSLDLTIALPIGTGMRTRSSWNYISNVYLYFSAALNDEINETQNFLDLNNIVLLNEDLIISSINPQKIDIFIKLYSFIFKFNTSSDK